MLCSDPNSLKAIDYAPRKVENFELWFLENNYLNNKNKIKARQEILRTRSMYWTFLNRRININYHFQCQ